MKNKKSIVLIVGVALFIVLAFVSLSKVKTEQEVSTDAPVDVVFDFYHQWLDELNSPDDDPYRSGLSKSPILSPELRKKIKNAKGDEIDPVLCQSRHDIEISTRRVFEGEEEVQILVTAKDKSLTGQATITLLKYNEGWYINNIKCSPGEFGEEREFTFDNQGYLIKGSNLESFNPQTWYIVFEEDEEPGHSAPLIFSSESMCIDKKGNSGVCVPDQLEDVAKVYIKGQMTESGIDLKTLEFIK